MILTSYSTLLKKREKWSIVLRDALHEFMVRIECKDLGLDFRITM
jgi:hypothetical protein